MTTKRKPLDARAFANAAAPQPDPVELATSPKQSPAASAPKGGRASKVQIQGYFPEETRRRMKMLAAEQGRTVEDLLGEAIADVLAKHQMH